MAFVKGIFIKDSQQQWKEYKEIYLDSKEINEGEEDLSIITIEGFNKLKNDEVKGFCHHKFHANFVIEGIDPRNLLPGTILHMGDIIIEVTNKTKKCHFNCPVLSSNYPPCALNKHIVFGKLLKSGKIAYKDKITI